MTDSQVIVVGGGLSGFSAANTLLEHGADVVLLDKSAFCGGNSTKATSGINGGPTRTQIEQGIKDSVELFQSDCIKGGAKKPELVKTLCENSGADVEWLMDAFDLDLSLVARLGGHSAPRTHRGKERFPGMTITYALIEMFEKIVSLQKPAGQGRARMINKARVVDLIYTEGKVTGVIYEKDGQRLEEHGPVILATGGFGADFSEDSLLKKYRPDLLPLATTNGEHCTGDGIKLGEKIGAQTIDLDFVQVHPTGLVNPDDPDAKIKFLAAEALRGVGGILLDAKGERFCNDLGRRDYVSGKMFENQGPFRLVLNSKSSAEIKWHCEHYKGRGIMKFFKSGHELAKEMGLSSDVLHQTFSTYNSVAEKQLQDPDNGPYDAYPSGKSHDIWGKKFFTNLPLSVDDEFNVAIVTPLIHYCMGGLEINTWSQCLGPNGPIPGLYASGEVAGGVHGNNRLGGNSLLDCVVLGRQAARHCAKEILGLEKKLSLKEISNSLHKVKAAEAASAGSAGVKVYTEAEVAKHTTKDDCWVIINGQVLDCTKFLPDHPGGALAILTFAGRDATAEFNMIHPAGVIEKYAPDTVIGATGSVAAAATGFAGSNDKSISNEQAWGSWREDAQLEGGIFGQKALIGSIYKMITVFLVEVLKTIFFTGNIKLTNDRKGLTRSAFFLVMFQVIHAIGNLHLFLGPDDFNGYGYFYVRLYWTGFGLNANIVEEYLLLAALLHVVVGLKRTLDITAKYPMQTSLSGFGQWNLAVTGVALLSFMIIHLIQFRFAETAMYMVRPPPYMINFAGILSLNLFWTDDLSVEPVPVRDIYKLEWDLFANLGWVIFYILATLVFTTHFILGWLKLVPSSQLKIHPIYHGKIKLMGALIAIFVGACYISFPLYVYMYADSPKLGPSGDF